MARTKASTPAERARPRALAAKKNRGHILQFTLVLTAAIVLLGSIIAWKVCNQSEQWRAWAFDFRKGLLGFRDTAGDGPDGADQSLEPVGDSIHYHGSGYAEMGEFSVGRFDAVTGTTFKINFLLSGMTTWSDEASFEQFMRENHRTFREQVTTTIRDCRVADFADDRSLGRKVKARVNRAFGKTVLEAVNLQDFEVSEYVQGFSSEPWQTYDEELASLPAPP